MGIPVTITQRDDKKVDVLVFNMNDLSKLKSASAC